MQLKSGDNFVRFSKYGGKIFGVVKVIYKTTCMLEDCDIFKLKVKSTNNVDYDYNECFKSTAKFNHAEIEKRKLAIKRIKRFSENKYQSFNDMLKANEIR